MLCETSKALELHIGWGTCKGVAAWLALLPRQADSAAATAHLPSATGSQLHVSLA